ncbi:MAG: hypothetical protein M9930_03985 [Anaerolineae bacterium]|nr:hypothetical protein [Anaerolineae bacterium]
MQEILWKLWEMLAGVIQTILQTIIDATAAFAYWVLDMINANTSSEKMRGVVCALLGFFLIALVLNRWRYLTKTRKGYFKPVPQSFHPTDSGLVRGLRFLWGFFTFLAISFFVFVFAYAWYTYATTVW